MMVGASMRTTEMEISTRTPLTGSRGMERGLGSAVVEGTRTSPATGYRVDGRGVSRPTRVTPHSV